MLTLEILFWLCLAIVFYTYIGYGLVLWCIVKVRRILSHGGRREPPLPADSALPPMTLMICAYNEEAVVREKMANCRLLDYPLGRITVMWVTDGSTDNTNALLRDYAEAEVVFSPERRGKAAAMQHGLEVNVNDIVVFTDANTMLNRGALKEIARLMQDESVGCVSGEKRVAVRNEGQEAARGEGLYWRYESTLKRLDSELYSAMGAAGELFAVRMSCYEPAPSNALLDDFMISMLILKSGYRIAYTSEAYAMEYGSASVADEGIRKQRIAAGGLQSVWWLRQLMNPLRHPRVAFQFVSHRVLRWTVTPFALMALVPLNVILVLMKAPVVYTVVWILQLLFYLAAFLGYSIGRKNRLGRVYFVAYYFLFMNVNVFRGIRYLRSHRSSGTWEKAKRG